MNLQGATVAGGDDRRVQTSDRRFNAVKHGLTAKTPVLPGEDPAALEALIDEFKEGYETRNKVEEALARLAAISAWQVDRADRLEVTRVTRDLAGRSEAEAVRATLDAADLGHRLLFDRRGPAELYPSRDYENKQPRTSESGDPGDPDAPHKLVIRLEATRAGRCLLLEEWGELRKPIDAGSVWHSSQKLKAIRLLGRQPLHSVWDEQVALVFLASHAIKRTFASAFHELRCEVQEERFKITKAWLERDEMQAITPASAAEGRAVLLDIVDRAIERLQRLEAARAETADFVEELDGQIPSDEETKTVAGVQRHRGSCNRLMHRNLEAIDKRRRYEAEGWGRTRAERESRKQGARHSKATWYSLLVVDEHGTVREADAYDGDIKEGLARYKAKFGLQPYEYELAEPQEIDRGSKHVIPDFARWVDGENGPGVETQDGGRKSEGGGRDADVIAERASDQRGEGCDAEHRNESLPVLEGRDFEIAQLISHGTLLPAGKEDGAKVQNETAIEAAMETTVELPVASVVVERVEAGESPCPAEGGMGPSAYGFVARERTRGPRERAGATFQEGEEAPAERTGPEGSSAPAEGSASGPRRASRRGALQYSMAAAEPGRDCTEVFAEIAVTGSGSGRLAGPSRLVVIRVRGNEVTCMISEHAGPNRSSLSLDISWMHVLWRLVSNLPLRTRTELVSNDLGRRDLEVLHGHCECVPNSLVGIETGHSATRHAVGRPSCPP